MDLINDVLIIVFCFCEVQAQTHITHALFDKSESNKDHHRAQKGFVDARWTNSHANTKSLHNPQALAKLLMQFNLPDAVEDAISSQVNIKGHRVSIDSNIKTPSQLAHAPYAIQHHLSPRFFEQPELLEEARKRLHAGQVVVWRDAFKPMMAEVIYRELDTCPKWPHNIAASPTGFHFSHHNVYTPSEQTIYTPLTQNLTQIWQDPETVKFMEYLSGRDCRGPVQIAPSFYMPGDHSLPHNDLNEQRSVAFVWHLAKNWRPEWGGAMYWIPTHKYWHAEFNTLYLFSVTRRSNHFVTAVSPFATEKRLAVNGWWQAKWLPKTLEDCESLLQSEESSLHMTASQLLTMLDVLGRTNGNWEIDERRNALKAKALSVFEKCKGDAE